MARYYLDHGIIHDALSREPGFTPERMFHLAADGMLQEVNQIPQLTPGEGLLLYAGDLYVEPLEIQIEFLKATNAETWLEGILQRHAIRVREFSDRLFVLSEIQEVTHES